MNKIEVISDNVITNEISDIASISTNTDLLTIHFSGSNIEPIVLINNVYKMISIVIEDNATINIVEIKDINGLDKYTYEYVIGNNSKAIINKFYYGDVYEEDITINLKGYASSVLCNLSAISLGHHIYNISINHLNKKTISNINNHGVTEDQGMIDFIINGVIKKGMSDSELFQDNKIMTLGNGKCTIKPNLFIDENMVEARHGASIGRFNEDEIFYLQSRGIPENIGYQMLSKGFLLGTLNITNEMREKIEDIINTFRR